MKPLKLLTLLSLMPFMGIAQPDFSQLSKEKMAQLDLMIGTWKGTGYMFTPAGKDSSEVTETIQYKLNETVLFIEGQGVKTNEDGSSEVVHDALGIISFNPFTKQYQMNSFLSKGMSTQAKFRIDSANRMTWWFESGPMTIRYSITIGDGIWTEIGERSSDGQNWQQFFEMNLKKVS